MANTQGPNGTRPTGRRSHPHLAPVARSSRSALRPDRRRSLSPAAVRNTCHFVAASTRSDRQRQPADDLEIVAQSEDAGQRLDATPNSATYEITSDVQIKQAGRYAVRVGGRAPDMIYPPGDPTLPFQRKYSEMRVRLFVSPLDATGRAIFHDYATANGSVGMPADARTAITVVPPTFATMQPYTAGAPFGLDLLMKPDMLAYDNDGVRPNRRVCCRSGGVGPPAGRTPTACLQNLHIPPGGVLRLPDGVSK